MPDTPPTPDMSEHAAAEELIAAAVRPALAAYPRSTLAVGVLARGQRTQRAFGATAPTPASAAPSESECAPDAHAIFEIGSITKVFTSTLLAVMVTEGLVRLDDPVRELLPAAQALPADITLRRLATHTSGLPRLPLNLFWRSLWRDTRNPYAAYTQAHLDAYLAHYHPRRRRTVGTFRYSNLGGGLLGHVLARRLGLTYEQALGRHIWDPLALADTRITLTPAQHTRLLPPYSARGRRTANWDLPALAGAGAIRSTSDDLLTWLAANLDPARTPLAAALELCQRPQAPAPGMGQIGLGWIIGAAEDAGGAPIHWHNGGTGGYSAFAAFDRTHQLAVAVLTNHGPDIRRRAQSLTPDAIGWQVLRQLRRT